MKPVFADAHFWIALLNPRDQDHAVAVELSRGREQMVVTTRWVLAEVANALSAPPLRILVGQFLSRFSESRLLQVVPVSEVQFMRGLDLYRSRPDKFWSLTDCISFTVMEEKGLGEALTGDRHFRQAGFRALLAE